MPKYYVHLQSNEITVMLVLNRYNEEIQELLKEVSGGLNIEGIIVGDILFGSENYTEIKSIEQLEEEINMFQFGLPLADKWEALGGLLFKHSEVVGKRLGIYPIFYTGTVDLDDVPDGKGVRWELDGLTEEGVFVNGKLHGKGKITRGDKVLFDGEFIDGLPSTGLPLWHYDN
jgi:hypothetical protein